MLHRCKPGTLSRRWRRGRDWWRGVCDWWRGVCDRRRGSCGWRHGSWSRRGGDRSWRRGLRSRWRGGCGRRGGFLGLLLADDLKLHLRKIVCRIQKGVLKKFGQGNPPLVGKFGDQLLLFLLGQNPVPADEQVFHQVFNIQVDIGLGIDFSNGFHALSWLVIARCPLHAGQ